MFTIVRLFCSRGRETSLVILKRLHSPRSFIWGLLVLAFLKGFSFLAFIKGLLSLPRYGHGKFTLSVTVVLIH